MIFQENRLYTFLICGMLLQISFEVQATLPSPASKAKVSSLPDDTQPIIIKFTNKPFSEIATSIEQQSNIKIQIVPFLQNKLITADIHASSWENAIAQLLNNYNRAGFIDKYGRTSRILVTGINGNGSDSITSPEDLFNYSENNVLQKIPDHLKKLPDGSVIRINFNKSMLKNMVLGDALPLSLPIGQFNVIHDNFVSDKNGDFTWIGYIEGAFPKSRVILTFDNNHSFGRIQTPYGVFRVETSAGVDWLVDVEGAGLNPEPLQEDTIVNQLPVAEQSGTDTELTNNINPLKIQQPTSYVVNTNITAKDLKKSTTVTHANKQSLPIAAKSIPAKIVTIDIMVLFTEGLETARIKNLIEISNQAFKDSHVQIQLRLVHTQRVYYPYPTSNETALYDLSFGRKTLTGFDALRITHGADLVSFIRPFDAEIHKGCGLAWIGGAGGRKFNSAEAYSVVSNGIDDFHYCTDYTFVHELSHNMGSSHDRENASYQGIFPYSYGHNVDGQYGTIMSYSAAELGLFSNPGITCLDQPCGVDVEQENPADNALSLNYAATAVAGFMQSVHSDSLFETNKKKPLELFNSEN
ncbi:hypothetical protein AU255_06235 [Methyloprofundus sedimenti]|uniref:Peptidase M12B domain-containing protein n=1 Tax=Methyloprofundus sedimenti TaxID=1420851 RepID=A0A1V8M7C1_9GAMM|nr:M12 family metallo-peptidase [Methyloprofundus sedimenti]OQK17474.1 hypothetical protein AU255_06235 [Methyloprofundus sedimenti]